MMGQRKIIAGLGAGVFAVSLMMAAAPSANASGTQDYCPAGRVCLWFNSNYGGARADFRVSDANLSNELFNDGPAGANGWRVQVEDNAASYHNRSGIGMIFYNLRNCNADGAYRTVGPGGKDNFGDLLKNRVSSIFIYGGDGGCANVDQSNA
jgi:Peptidase inhibitor family I36